MRHRATPEGVDAATITIFTFAGLPFVAAVDKLPEPIGLRWHHAGPAKFFAEEAAYGQGLVANLLGFQSHVRPSREQSVVRVALHQFGRSPGALAISGGHNDELVHGFEVPVHAHEFGRQPIKQLDIGGWLTLGAEILCGFHDANAEILFPNAVHRHARSKRIVCGDQPTRQGETVWRRALREGMENGRGSRANQLALAQEPATDQAVRLARLFELNHD